MKKSIIWILGAAAILAGCAKESENTGVIVPEGKELVKIIASAEQSRTTVDIDGICANYTWNLSDTLAVVEEDALEPAKFSLVDAATGTFVGVKSEGKSLVYAVTPSSVLAEGMDVEGQLQEFTISLPDYYEDYVPGTTNAVMFGTPAEVTDNGYKFNFSHAAAVVKVSYENVPVGTDGLCLTMDKSITGSWTFDALDDVVLTTTPQGSSSVWLQLKEPVSIVNQSLDFYIPVPVGEYSSFEVVLFDEKFEEIDGTKRSKNASTTLNRGDLFTTPVITLPATSLAGSYIIVSKPSTKGYWAAMQTVTGGNNNDYWVASESEISYDQDVNLLDSSVDFTEFSNIDYRFEVEMLEEGGYVLRNASTGKYIQYKGSGNAGKEVEAEEKTAFDVFKINSDGSWTIGTVAGSDTYSLEYNSGASPKRFTFYKGTQQAIYLIPYVGAATPVKLSGSCKSNVVTLTAVPAEAEIHYTLDGSEPDALSTLYEEPFEITETVTVKAIAIAPDSGYSDSDVFELECSYIEPGKATYYVKVTSAPVTDGQYLIVYEGGDSPVAFDGSLKTLDAVSNYITVEISDSGILRTEETSASEFTINTAAGTLCSASGYYIGVSSNSNGLKQTDNSATYTHNFSIDNSGNAVIAAVFEGSIMTLRFNAASNQDRFRYYKNSGQQPITLYKLSDSREALATPDGLSIEGMTLSWNAVENAESYTVTVGTTVESVQGTSYTYEGEAGYYNVSVVAVPASDSDYSTSGAAVLENAKFGTPVLPAPELSAGVCTGNSVQVTWTPDERATNGYHATIGITGAEAEIESKDVTEGSVSFDGLQGDTEYTVSVYANAVEGDLPWEASQSTSIELSTTQGSATIADAVAACPSDSYSLTGVTVVGVASSSNAFIGDGTGFALIYKSSHGLTAGDVINVSGATARYNGIVEFVQPAIETTGSAPAIEYGDPVSPTAEMMQAWTAGDFDITYISAKGTQSGRNITLDNGYVLYMHTTNAATDGKPVNVSGLVYGWSSNHSNFSFFFTSIELDSSAPSLEVTPLAKTWAYNETASAEFTVTAANGTWDYAITSPSLSWASIERTDTGLTITPNGENDTENDYTGIVTVTLTPSNGGDELTKDIVLTQTKNKGGGEPTEEEITTGTFSGDKSSISMTTASGITITQLKNGGTDVNTTYNTVSTLRVYRANQLSFTGQTFTKIEMYYTGSYSGADWSVAEGNGTVSIDATNKKVVWENASGSSTVTLQNSTASGTNTQLRTTKFVVTY